MAEPDPDTAAFLARIAGGSRLQDGTPEQARAGHLASALALAGPGPELASVTDEQIGGVPVRRFVPTGARGVTVYAHGGGWVVGTLDSYDTLCRMLALSSGSTVLSVGYDLAPEAQHPRQIGQVLAVARYAVAAGHRVALAGDSAGGYLAAVAAQRAAAEGLSLAAQALVYPAVSPALDTASAADHAEGYYLETAAMRWYWDHYLGGRAATPLLARADLPPTLVLTAGLDPLRDEGQAHADALEKVGVEVTRLEVEDQIHGFVRFTALLPTAQPALSDVGAFLHAHLR
ncbi:MAG: alpha/beta hydrolase [Mycobacteriales bacterium]